MSDYRDLLGCGFVTHDDSLTLPISPLTLTTLIAAVPETGWSRAGQCANPVPARGRGGKQAEWGATRCPKVFSALPNRYPCREKELSPLLSDAQVLPRTHRTLFSPLYFSSSSAPVEPPDMLSPPRSESRYACAMKAFATSSLRALGSSCARSGPVLQQRWASEEKVSACRCGKGNVYSQAVSLT